MRLLLASILIASFSMPVTAALAKGKPQPPSHSVDASIFVFQGAECPPGSYDYRGPEAQIIKDTNPGFLYCRFLTTVRIIKKRGEDDKCPPGTKSYESNKYKPEPGIMWCDDDPSFKPQKNNLPGVALQPQGVPKQP